MKQYKLLIFDWDGTLINSMAFIVDSVTMVAQHRGLPVPSPAVIYAQIGLNIDTIFTNMYPNLSEELCIQLTQDYKDYYMRQDIDETLLFKGIKSQLAQWQAQGYYLAIATGKGRQGLDKALQDLELTPFFTITRTADEAHSKPHPDMLLQILDVTGITARQALMVGDSKYDLQMANNAGVDVVAVSSGTQPAEELMIYNPMVCLDSVIDLNDWLTLPYNRRNTYE